MLFAWPGLLWRASVGQSDRARLTARFSGILIVWSGIWLALAATGSLTRIERRPPLVAVLPFALILGTIVLLRSRIGGLLARNAPLWLLVGFQAFRLPLELVMHRAAAEGTMPAQMSFGAIAGVTGLNYDIVSGITALLLAVVLRLRDLPRSLVLGWNILGSGLLLTILIVAILSTPLFALFGTKPAQLNTWILFSPFVWLVAVLVGSAIFGHALIFRKLLSAQSKGRSISPLSE